MKTLLSAATIGLSLVLPQVSFAELRVQVHAPAAASTAKDSTSVNSPREKKERDKEEEADAPLRGVNRYGKGETLSSQQHSRRTHFAVDRSVSDATGTARVEGRTVTGERRSRTYTEHGFLQRKVGTQHQANLVRSRYGVGYDSPAAVVGGVELIQYHNEAEVEAFVGAQADAEAGFDLSGSDPRAEVKAGVFVGARVDARASQSVDVLGASASTTVEGSASVGAEAGVEGALSKEGAEVKAGAFAGARAEGSVGGEVGGVGAKGTGEAWAGVGAEAEATATFEDGKLKLGTEAGAGIGVGGKLGYEATIDVHKVQHDSQALASNAGQLAQNLDLTDGHRRANAALSRIELKPVKATPVLGPPRPLGQRVFPAQGRTTGSVHQTIRHRAESTAQKAQATSRSVRQAGVAAGRKVKSTHRKVVGSAKKSVQRSQGTLKKAASRGSRTTKKAKKSVGKATKKIGKKLKSPFG